MARQRRLDQPIRARTGPSPTPAIALLGSVAYHRTMCRSIKTLRRADDPPTEEEIRAAALQFVRKVSGYRAPAQRNTVAFDSAVNEITDASRRLLDGLVTR